MEQELLITLVSQWGVGGVFLAVSYFLWRDYKALQTRSEERYDKLVETIIDQLALDDVTAQELRRDD